jgi:zinc protease
MKLKLLVILLTICLTVTIKAFTENSGKFISLYKDSVTAGSVINDYITKIGGREKLINLVDKTTEMKGSFEGKEVLITIFQKQPDLMKQVFTAGETEQVLLFDGEKGFMISSAGKTKITGDELTKLKYEANLTLIAELDENNIEAVLEGIDTVKGEDAYKIKLTLPNGLVWFHFYNIDSGLKVKEIKSINVPQGTFMQEIFYSDFREVNGLLFPFKVEQQLGVQHVSFEVISIEINSGLDDDIFIID